MNIAGGLTHVERQLQKIHLTVALYPRDFIDAAHHYPDISDELMSLYTSGAVPIYHPLPPKSAPDDGYPHNPKKAIKIIASMWGGYSETRGGAMRYDCAGLRSTVGVYSNDHGTAAVTR